jgi:adenylate cyclase
MPSHHEYKDERWTFPGADEPHSHLSIDSSHAFVQFGTMISITMRTLLVSALLTGLAFTASAQPNVDSILHVLETAPPDSDRLRSLHRAGTIFLERGDLDKAIALYTELLELARKLGNTRAQGLGLEQLGTANYYLGRAPVAMDYWQQSMAIRLALADSTDIYALRMNMANGMVSMDDLEQGLRAFFEVLAWADRNGNRSFQASCLSNIAMVYALQGKLEDAASNYRRLLVDLKSAITPGDRSIALTNLGQVHLDMGQPDSARIIFTELKELAEAGRMIAALSTAELGLGNVARLAGDRIGARAHFERARLGYRAEDMANDVAIVQERMASLDREAVDSLDRAYLERFFNGAPQPALAEAHALLDSAITTFLVNEDTPNLMNAYSALSEVERAQGDHRSALEHHKLFKAWSDTLFNAERDKKLTETAMTYEFEKKQAAAKAEQEKKDQRQRLVRNAIAGGLAFSLLFLGVVWRQRNKINAARKRSDERLLNILPEEVADELKATGAAEAKHFDTATILFTDFKGFTQLSEKVTPAELVAELNTCFKAFDRIMEKYRIEKIKTIGDAYMAAGGLPDPQHGPPADVIRAALEMQDFMQQHKAEREAAGKPFFEMRVGIHSGPVVAGIVGVKKFQYDIWGDTVNTASRMESSGEVGKVNISEATYALVKDTPELTFTPRGKVQAKGKSEMEMYFVHRSSTGV